MKKTMPYLGAALASLAMAWATPALAQDTFKDLQQDHWAYSAVDQLQKQGILEGYPDGFFRGKRTLTRYEFAIAIKRLLDKLPSLLPPGPKGDKGDPGDPGTPGVGGTGGVTAEELAALRRLLDEFRGDLTALGTDVKAVRGRLDAAEKDIADIKEELAKQIKFSGSAFIGVRTDESRFAYPDYGGATRLPGRLLGNANVTHDFHLKATAPVNGEGRIYADIAFSNYLGGYRGYTLSQAAIANTQTQAGGVNSVNSEAILPYQLEFQLPVKLGKEGMLTLGRYKYQISPGIYQRPDLDPYFQVDAYDDGNFVQDGAKLTVGIGSFKTDFFAASFSTVTDVNGNQINLPLVGGAFTPTYIGKPFNIDATNQTVTANQVAGITTHAPFFSFGEFGLTALTFGTNSPLAGSSNITLFGGYIKPKPFGRFIVLAEGAKTIASTKLGNLGDGEFTGNEDNLFGNVSVGYATGPVKATVGYIYVDPRYGAPGNWLKIGNWYNPTNVRGPYIDLGFNASKGLRFNLVGNWLEGARNRGIGGLNIGDDIYRVKAGVSYAFSRGLNLGVDYEGVLYDLSTASTGLANRTEPNEQYITFSAGLNLSTNTVLKVGYQLLNFQNVGGGFGAGTGLNGFAAGGGNSINANVFTTQVQVKF